jgi:uncharacterized protein YlxW (UPF0749 family)
MTSILAIVAIVVVVVTAIVVWLVVRSKNKQISAITNEHLSCRKKLERWKSRADDLSDQVRRLKLEIANRELSDDDAIEKLVSAVNSWSSDNPVIVPVGTGSRTTGDGGEDSGE